MRAFPCLSCCAATDCWRYHCFSSVKVEVEIPQGATGGAKSGVAGFLNAVGGGGKKVRGGDNERPREICRMTKEIRATVIERSEELHRTWVTKTRKKVLNTHEYRLDKMNDVSLCTQFVGKNGFDTTAIALILRGLAVGLEGILANHSRGWPGVKGTLVSWTQRVPCSQQDVCF